MASGDKAKLITPGYIDTSGQPDGWFFDHSDTDVPAVELTSQEVVRVSGYTINELRQLSAYNPMHIPAWWHEEYLKSLEPKPPFDPIGFFDSLAYNICMFFARLGDAIFSGLTGKPSQPHKSFWLEQDERNNLIKRMLND